MSFGNFAAEGYTVLFRAGGFTLHTPAGASLRVTGFNPQNVNAEEDLQVTVHNPLHATVESSRYIMRFIYYDDPEHPNGQIELSEKVEDGVNNWLALHNELPRELILTAVSILAGTEHCEQYRMQPFNNNNDNNNNNNNSTLSNNEPRSVHSNNTTNSNTNNNNLFGGKRKQKRKTRKVKRT
jgi:hypothetical protein